MFNNFKEQKNNLIKEIDELETKKKSLNQDVDNMRMKKESLENDIIVLNEKKDKLNKELKNRQDFFVSAELKYVDSLSGLEFEKYCTELLIKNGYLAVTTKASGDDGGDIIAEKDNVKYVIQCKNYADTVGNKAVQEVYTAQGIYKADKSIVLTNNYFTNQAIKEAQILNISLWNREFLKCLINNAYDFSIMYIDDINANDRTEFEEADEINKYLKDAIEMVIETGQASTSFIQRKFIVGYSMAGRIIDKMEELGIISEYQGSNPRTVIITKDEWNKMKNQL